MTSYLACPGCGSRSPLDVAEYECACGDLLELRHESLTVDRELFDARATFPDPGMPSGVWRFRELVHPEIADEEIVSLAEGNTPLYRSPQVAAYTGARRVGIKHEGMNPTGSFKDRGMTVAVSHARRIGARRVVCASTGNTAASLAAFAAAGELRGLVLVPEGGTALGKLSQTIAYGAQVVSVRGDFDAAMQLVRTLARGGELHLCNSINPFRLEGQKTIVLELLQQRGWRPPDWLVFPAGNLGNTSSFGKALLEAREAGLIERLPRFAAVQAAGAAPFARAFERDFDQLEALVPETVASAIRIGNPVSYERAVRVIRATRGVVTSVDDGAILEAKAVVDAAGIGAEPASCASIAGLRQLVTSRVITPDEDVVCVLTGHLLKDSETTLGYHRDELEGHTAQRANRPVVIDATERALRALIEAD